MSRLKIGLIPAIGNGIYRNQSAKVIRFVRHGCANRPFYHIIATERRRTHKDPPIEQLGTFDPMANISNEKLVALNFDRIKYWIGNGARLTIPVAQLLGLSGFFPIHPKTYLTGWRNRRNIAEAEQKKEKPAE